jgi:hypothetical protein
MASAKKTGKKYKILRGLLGAKHSPAGNKFLNLGEDTYYRIKGLKRKTVEQRLKDAGISEARIIRMKGSLSKKKK